MAPPSALGGPVPPLGMTDFRHVTKCRGGSGGDSPGLLGSFDAPGSMGVPGKAGSPGRDGDQEIRGDRHLVAWIR